MKKELLRFTPYAIIIYLTGGALNPAIAASHPLGGNGTHFCGVIDGQSRFHRSTEDSKHPDNRNYARTFAANLNVGEPRTVRMIYFLPNDRPYRVEVIQQMKDEIRTVQTFFAEQMAAHGYGEVVPFRIETDPQGEPVVHRVDGLHPDKHYIEYTEDTVRAEIYPPFDIEQNVYLIVIDNSIDGIGRGESLYGGVGGRAGKNGGDALVSGRFGWGLVAHELGHAFGLMHDFSNGDYVMSYGGGGVSRSRLSQCHADALSVHSYFNPRISLEEPLYEEQSVELTSPRLYSASSKSIKVRTKLRDDSDGLHQVILHAAQPDNRWSVKACRKLGGQRETVIAFDYDGVIPSAHDPSYSRSTSLLNLLTHPIFVETIDTDGNLGGEWFMLFSEALEPLTKISGDNLQGLPNTPLPVPFVVELRDLNDGFPRYEVWVTFTVTAGGGRLSVERVKTDYTGRAESTLTLGPNLGTNVVEVSAEGLTVTFNAVAGAPVDIPDPNLRAAIEAALDKAPGTPIAPAEMANLTRLEARNANIGNLTGLKSAANLRSLDLGAEYVEAENRLINSNSVSDFLPLTGLTKLRSLYLGDSNISDISSMAGLTSLTTLYLWNNSISDISAVAGLINLTDLNLDNNSVSNISAVSGLTNLVSLNLGGNSVSNISAVSGLTNLTRLTLWGNFVSDISAVSGLTNLRTLDLGGNSISDVSAVARLTQLTRLTLWNNAIWDVSPLLGLNLTGTEWDSTGLYLEGNPLSYPSINTHIPAIQSKGIEIKFDNRTPTTLVKISGTEQQGVVNTVLPHPFVVEVRDEWHRAFSGVPVTFTVTAGGGTLSVTHTTTNENGRAQVHLTLGQTGGITTVSVSAAEISQPMRFTATALRLSSPVTVPDAALRTKIAETLGKLPSRALTVGDMLRLTTLTANNANIRELTGLHHASNLTTLSLDNNTFSDVSPLGGLPQLTTLSLNNSSLSDLTPITGLTQLITLSLDNNNLSDISTLVELTQLKTLHLRGNPLSYPSLRTHIPAMQANGVVVTVDSRTPTTLLNISGAHGVAGAALPLVVEVQDQHNRAFLGVPVTFTVTVGGGKLSATTATTDITGRARTSLTLGRTPGRNTVRVSAPEVSQAVSFTITAIEGSSSVTVPDADLRAKITETLGKSEDVQFTAGDMLALTRLDAPNANIQALTGLEYAYTLRTLNLGGEWVSGEGFVNSNVVSDFSPLLELTQLTTLDLSGISLFDTSALSGLTQLTSLNLWNNSVSDISSVSRLTNLTWLDLGGNSVSDISAVSGLTQLTSLYLWGNNVSDISAVAGLTNLTDLNVNNNSVSNISAISGLTNLVSLNLGGNSVSDISSVSGLTQLTSLYLWGNNVSDISAVAGLTNLTDLNVDNNSVSDISSVSRLTNLTRLSLRNNSISDVSAVSGLTQLTQLNLSNNTISDVSPLLGVNLIGTSWDSTGLYLEGNPLSYLSINTHIPAIQSKGIEVKFDNRIPTTLLNISGVITESDNVLAVEVRDSNGRTFEGVPVTFTVTSGGGTLSVTNTTTDEKGRAQSTLTLGKESNRVKVSAVGTARTVTFSDVAEAGVHIPDPNLRAAIEDALGVKSGSPISSEEMATLTHFWARDASIGVLIGLEFATDLTELRLGDNNITDISSLSGLINLRRLGLGRNSVTDISPLSGLTNLRRLGLSNNGITDVSALVSVLSGLTNLTALHLKDNGITDISSLSGLTNLTELRLSGNRVRDISPLLGLTNLRNLELPSGIQDLPALGRVLSSMTHLTSLSLLNNNIADVSALIPVLSDLTDLRDLNLNDNDITNLSPLAVLTNLTSLHLWNNNISDISAIVVLTNLTNLYLGNNSISDLSPLAELTNLTSLNLWNNNISDILPLVENTGLGSQDWGWVGVRENPLSYQSIHTHIPALQNRGVTVEFDNQAHPALLKISGDNQRGAPGEILVNPLVVEMQDENGSALRGISVTFVVTTGGGTLSVTNTTTDGNGRARSLLTLGPNVGTNTVQVRVEDISQMAVFNAEVTPPLPIPTTLEYVSGDNQSGLTGETLMQPFIVEVHDQYKDPMEGVAVTFAVSAGSGSLSDASVDTDVNGLAQSTLTLGDDPGTYTVEVSVEGISPKVVFNAEASLRPPEPTMLSSVSGDNQMGLISETLMNPFVVEVRDQYDDPMEGVAVTFALLVGGGSLNPEVATTDVNGQAESTLTFGSDPGTYTVEVSVEGISPKVVFNAEASLRPPEPTMLSSVSGDNQMGLISETLMNPFVVEVRDQYDDPMEGVVVTFALLVGSGSLSLEVGTTDANGQAESTLTFGSDSGTYTVEVSAEGITEIVPFNAIAELLKFDLALPSGISLIHIPLKVRMVDGVAGTIESVGDLYDALGGTSSVNFLITYDSESQEWLSYFVSSDKGTTADAPLADDTGIIAGLRAPASIHLSGDPLGTDGSSTIALNQGLNVVGLPLRDSRVTRVSDLFALDGIRGNAPVIILTDGGEFKAVGRADDLGDVPVTGGQAFILTAQREAAVEISGGGWYNSSTTAAAPPPALTGVEVGDTTPVLGLRGGNS